MTADELRSKILELVGEYHAAKWPERTFLPGESAVPVSGKVFDAADMQNLVDASLDFWLTTGRFAAQFEKEFARFLGVRHAILCNSGSSANLLALSALTSPLLGARQLQPGDEVITCAAGFPTTVNPILQNQCVPVFLDIEPGTYEINVDAIESAIGPRTKAIMVAHTLGNPFRVAEVVEIARKHNLWLIEDNCDALGATYRGQYTGTFGDLATVSFYPAHHITTGEGGMVITNHPKLKTLVESFRDWGRDCWCEPGEENTCGKRFEWQLGDLPFGYDHKYIYSHIGYNLKMTDMQAAVGLTQLKKLPDFIAARKRNWQMLYDGLKEFEEFLLLPQATPNSDPSWFGFILSVRPNPFYTRNELVSYLESHKIATRLLFGGNLTRQPGYKNVPYRTVGSLENSDFVMNNSFWIGVFPGLDTNAIHYMIDIFSEFFHHKIEHGASS